MGSGNYLRSNGLDRRSAGIPRRPFTFLKFQETEQAFRWFIDTDAAAVYRRGFRRGFAPGRGDAIPGFVPVGSARSPQPSSRLW